MKQKFKTKIFRFANLQNLRRHLRLHLKRDSHLAEIDSEGEEKVQPHRILIIRNIIVTVMISSTRTNVNISSTTKRDITH